MVTEFIGRFSLNDTQSELSENILANPVQSTKMSPSIILSLQTIFSTSPFGFLIISETVSEM